MKDSQDNETVFYCSHCHSLSILVNEDMAGDDWDGSYCSKCGSTEITEGTIEQWLDEEEKLREMKRRVEWNR